VCFQEGRFFSSMSVEENSSYRWRELTTLADPVIEIMTFIKLASVGLSEAGKLLPQEYPGGMRKTAAVARATALDAGDTHFRRALGGLESHCPLRNSMS